VHKFPTTIQDFPGEGALEPTLAHLRYAQTPVVLGLPRPISAK